MPELILIIVIIIIFDTVAKLTKFYFSKRGISWGDTAFHFAYILEIKKNNHRIPYQPSYALKRAGGYPFLFHWLLSFLPENWIRKNSGVISILFEELYIILIGIVAHLFFKDVGVDKNIILPLCVMVVALFVINPQEWGHNPSNPYQVDLSPRSLGKLLASAGCFFLVLGLNYKMPIFFILSALSVALAALSSKFAMQVLLFTFSGIALMLFNIKPLIIFFAGIILAFIFSWGLYYNIILSQIKHLIGYYRLVKDVHPMTTDVYAFDIKHLFQVVKNPRLFRTDPFLRQIFFCGPQMLFGIISFIIFKNITNNLFYLFQIWFLVNIFLWVAILHNKLKFIGEADRYMDFSGNIPLNILAAFTVFNFKSDLFKIVGLIILFGWPLLLHQILSLKRDEETNKYLAGLKEEIKKLNELPSGIILELPIRFSDFIVSCGITKHKFIIGIPVFDTEAIEELYDAYPFTDKKIDNLIKKYNVDYLVIIRRYFDELKYEIKYHDLSKHRVFFKGNYIHIYCIKKV